MKRIDLNADLGEGAGQDEALLEIVSSANIACGMHAGGPIESFHALRASASRGVVAGAHPGHADRERFGRVPIELPLGELRALLEYQVGALTAVAELAGTRLVHLKPHGALYHQAAASMEVAAAVAETASRWRLAVVGPPTSSLHQACLGRAAFVPEGFLDRRYGPDGNLLPRTDPRALIQDAGEAVEQALRLMDAGVATLCVHGDTPGAVGLARRVRLGLEALGVAIRPAIGNVFPRPGGDPA